MLLTDLHASSGWQAAQPPRLPLTLPWLLICPCLACRHAKLSGGPAVGRALPAVGGRRHQRACRGGRQQRRSTCPGKYLCCAQQFVEQHSHRRFCQRVCILHLSCSSSPVMLLCPASLPPSSVLPEQLSLDMLSLRGGAEALRLWSAEQPHLYVLLLELQCSTGDGQVLEIEACQVSCSRMRARCSGLCFSQLMPWSAMAGNMLCLCDACRAAHPCAGGLPARRDQRPPAAAQWAAHHAKRWAEI